MNRRDKLFAWVKEQYQGRLIRVSREPYFDHVLFVAKTAEPYIEFGYEIGLCHDMPEDGICTITEVWETLFSFGYTVQEIQNIINPVSELTDVPYPELNKKQRRQKKEERLEKAGAAAQTVKYADLLYNMDWTVRFEPKKAKRYLKRKLKLLKALDNGNPELRQRAIDYNIRLEQSLA